MELRPRALSALSRGRLAALAAAAALVALLVPSPASAATTTGKSAFPTLTSISTQQDQPPKGFRLTPLQAIAIAQRAPKISDELRRHPHLTPATYTQSGRRWQVSWFRGSKEMAQAVT